MCTKCETRDTFCPSLRGQSSQRSFRAKTRHVKATTLTVFAQFTEVDPRRNCFRLPMGDYDWLASCGRRKRRDQRFRQPFIVPDPDRGAVCLVVCACGGHDLPTGGTLQHNENAVSLVDVTVAFSPLAGSSSAVGIRMLLMRCLGSHHRLQTATKSFRN